MSLSSSHLPTESLEPRLLLAASVVGRHVFYNNSAFDGGSAAADARDDLAIAVDKQPLLPGSGPAAFANITGFSKGLNGVMVDLAGLSPGAQLSAADFTFRVGSGGTPGSEPVTWAPPSALPTVTARPGAGTGGSTRVTLTFPDGAVRSTWLQVTIHPTAATGLDFADVFCFGNLVSESGDGSTTASAAARVSAADLRRTRAALGQGAGIQNPFDHNRDGRVNSVDVWLVRSNYGRSLRPLRSPSYDVAFSTYLGGSAYEQIRDITTDAAGNVYVTGGGDSPDFPTTPGAFDRTPNGNFDVFVTKYAPDGRMIWSTVIGGSQYDRAYGIEVDAQGSVYVAGRAGSGFPTTAGSFQPVYNGFYTGNAYGNQNAFVAKLLPDGSGLVWASYFGPFELIRDLDVDASGDVYVAGTHKTGQAGTAPDAWFTGSYQPTPRGGTETVLAKVSGDGSRVAWATYFGGSANDGLAPSVRVDSTGSPYLASTSRSTNLPTTAGAFDRTYNGGEDMFVARFTPDGRGLLYGTYVGGTLNESGETHNLAIDPQGNAYLAAYTNSTDLPTTPGAHRRTNAGLGDAFVTKLSPTGTLLASTYFGGRGGEGVQGITTDLFGNVYISGGTGSDNLPTTEGAVQRSYGGGTADFYVARLSGDLSAVQFCTYLGGPGADDARTSHADPSGNVFLAGHVEDLFPTRNAHQARYAGRTDSAVAKLILLA